MSLIEVNGVTEDVLANHGYELSVLVSIMTYTDAANSIPELHESMFTLQTHQAVFKACKKLFEQGKQVDELTVLHTVKSLGEEGKGVNEKYLLEAFQNLSGNGLNFRTYVKELQELTLRRKLRDIGKKTQIFANDLSAGTADDVVAKSNSLFNDLDNLSGGDGLEDGIISAYELMNELNEIQTKKLNNTYKPMGVNTGFIALDHRVGEIKKGDLVVIAARPAMGKTAFALNVATNIFTNLNKPVLFESMEMKKKEIQRRLISSIGGIEFDHLKSADLTKEDWSGVTHAMKVIQASKYKINDGSVTISDIRKHARKVVQQHGCIGAIIVDYLQLIKTPHFNANVSENDRITYISNSLKDIAMSFDCPVFALCQLNRDLERRPDKRPMMADLRGSGAIEQDADAILFLYRDEYYNKDKSQFKGILEVITGKLRDGQTGHTYLVSELNMSRFSTAGQAQLEYLAEIEQRGKKS